MKNFHILILSALIALSSCTTNSEWNRGVTGAYLGSMFGSIIGDMVGGYHGSNMGALVGGATGAAIGVASAKADQERRENQGRRPHRQYDNYDNNYDNGYGNGYEDIHYGNGDDYAYSAPVSPSRYLDIRNLVFADANSNRLLEAGEKAYITFDIVNQSDRTIYNVAPIITCDNRRVKVSPTATIAKIDGGRGMRYKAMVVAQSNVRSGQATFVVNFDESGRRPEPVKTFRINVRR